MDEILDYVRANGEPYHYRLCCGIVWMLERFPSDAELANILNEVGQLPAMQLANDYATTAKQCLFRYSKQIDAVPYAAIYSALNDAVNETT